MTLDGAKSAKSSFANVFKAWIRSNPYPSLTAWLSALNSALREIALVIIPVTIPATITIPMIIIGLEPFETFKISSTAEVVRTNHVIDDSLINHKVMVTKTDDYSTYKGIVTEVEEVVVAGEEELQITVQKSRNNMREFTERMIRFLEVLD